MLNRKNRMLLLSALILTVVFVLIATTNNAESEQVSNYENGATKQELKQKEEVALKLQNSDNLNDVVRNPKSGEIDESKVKQAEEIISEKKTAPKKELLKEDHVRAPELTNDDATANLNADLVLFDLAKEFKQILSVSPVVIFSKTYCPYSKLLKSLLKTQYNITPEPAVVELDKHENGAELQKYIGELSGRSTVPNLFINGVSRGGSDDMHELHSKNELLVQLVEWGGKTVSVHKVNAPSNS